MVTVEVRRMPVGRRTFLTAGSLAVLGACAEGAAPGRSAGAATALVSPTSGVRSARLDDVLAARRSVRSFTGEPVDERSIARLLWAAQGVTASRGGRTAPSAGALYPIEVYVATSRSLRRYVAAQRGTAEVAPEDRRSAIAAATGQDPASAAPAVFAIAGVVARAAPKYGDRAERYVQLEAGHVCQNLLLEATALGLGAVPMGAFDDDAVRAALGAPDDELPLYVVPVGHPADA